MTDITSANTIFTISIPNLLPTATQVQGYAADDIFDFDEVDTAQTLMGVDGILSGGMVFEPKPQMITLQADSASNAIFDQWNQAQQLGMQIFAAFATVLFPNLGYTWSLSKGILTRYRPLPPAKRLLQPRTYRVVWERVVPSAVSGGG